MPASVRGKLAATSSDLNVHESNLHFKQFTLSYPTLSTTTTTPCYSFIATALAEEGAKLNCPEDALPIRYRFTPLSTLAIGPTTTLSFLYTSTPCQHPSSRGPATRVARLGPIYPRLPYALYPAIVPGFSWMSPSGSTRCLCHARLSLLVPSTSGRQVPN